MKITLASVCVDDQAKALDFYVGVLGFVSMFRRPLGYFARRALGRPDPEDGEEDGA